MTWLPLEPAIVPALLAKHVLHLLEGGIEAPAETERKEHDGETGAASERSAVLTMTRGRKNMSRLTVAMQISIDGYVDSSLLDTTWQLWNWSPDWPWSADLRAAFNGLLAGASGILLSRPMADEGYLGHWSRMAEQHSGDPDWEFSRAIGALPKFVVSRSGRPELDWPRTTVLNGKLADTVEQAKKQADGDLLCFGGAGLVSSLLREDLADELRLFTNPGFAGTGTSVFGPWLATRNYRAADSAAYACGIVGTRWVR